MDVNDTRLHLVLGRADWERALVPPVDTAACLDERQHTVGLRPRPFVFPTPPTSTRLRPLDRRGAAADRHGNIFWIAEDRRSIRVLGTGQQAAFTWWPGGAIDPEPSETGFVVCARPEVAGLELSGLVVTTDGYLVVGVPSLPLDEERSTAGLLVFDLAGGGPPVPMTWPEDLRVRPFDLAATPDGGVVVLDIADPVAAGLARLWTLDGNLRLVDQSGVPPDSPPPPAFGPVEPRSVATEPTPPGAGRSISLEAATSAAAVDLPVEWATAVDVLPDGSVLVLARQGAAGHVEVTRWLCGQQRPFELRLDEPDDGAPSFLCTDQRSNAHEILVDALGHDFMVLRTAADEPGLARLYVVDERGDQAFEFVVDETGADLVTDYHPLRLFGGKALVAAGGLPFYDLGDRWYPVPVRPVRRFESAAVLELAPEDGQARGFDALVPGTVWHRLVLDAVVPAGCALTVESRAADDAVALQQMDWRHEPAPYLRGDGSEIPYHAYAPGPCPSQGTWELLFQSAVGRYLQVRITLLGDGRRSPRVWAVRVHFPRFSYLDEYLPDIYREDQESASFLDRYLANVEGMYTTLEGRIAAVQRVVDPTTLDADYLPWLASWIGAAVEPDWEAERVRLFVRNAAQMFTRRGTPRGLIEAIRLATHPCPSDALFDASYAGDAFDVRVVEAFRTRSVPGVVFGNPLELAGPRLTSGGERWEMADGGSRLVERWRDFLGNRHGVDASPGDFPVLTPSDADDAREWREFVRSELAPHYADVGSAADRAAFQDFLEHRYRRYDDYLAVWGSSASATTSRFADVDLPEALPPDGAPLQDWFMFVSAVLPSRRSAHRATVLVPIRMEDSDDERARRLGRVRRVVELERPAHTQVDVQPFWAALRVGEARVGLETIVGEGSRYVELVLGRSRVAHALLPGGATWRLDDRVVVGRDRIERSTRPSTGTGGLQ